MRGEAKGVRPLARLLCAAGLAFATAACSDLDTLRVALDERIINIDSKKPIDTQRTGVAFLSLGSGQAACAGGMFEIYFRSSDTSLPQMRFSAVTANMFGVSDAVMKRADACVELVGLSLPPGEYRITEAKWFFDMGMQTLRLDTTFKTGPTFSVRAGELAYLGSFLMSFEQGKNLFGNKVLAGGRYGVRDDLQRDKRKLDEMRPALKELAVSTQLPPDDSGPEGFPRVASTDAQ